MRRNYQGGSLAGFIIIAVLLGVALIGGLYGLNRYNAQKLAEEVKSEQEIAKDDTERTPAAEAPRSQEKTDTKPAPTKPSPAPAATPQAASGPSHTELPQTGPADTMFAMTAVFLLTFVGVHYLRSR